MLSVITDAQKLEIEKLANDGHYEALIGYGADMYRKGLTNGCIYAVVSYAGLKTIELVYKVVKKRKER